MEKYITAISYECECGEQLFMVKIVPTERNSNINIGDGLDLNIDVFKFAKLHTFFNGIIECPQCGKRHEL